MRKSKSNFILKIINIIFYFCLAIILSASVIFAINNNPRKSLFGYRFYNVLTNSMKAGKHDDFASGDIIIVKIMDAKNIKVGDIITFMPKFDSKFYLTHRVVDIKDKFNETKEIFFITKGDANKVEDPPISSDKFIGKKVFTIPFVGRALKFFHKNAK